MCVKRALDVILWLALSVISVGRVQAATSDSAMPIIFNAQERSVTTFISNSAPNAYLSRAWISDDSDQAQSLAPFIAMPSLFRLWGGEQQVVRIIRTPGDLPEDRELLFYLHVMGTAIAGRDDEKPDMASKAERVAFIYRPQHLISGAGEAAKQLQWRLLDRVTASHVQVINPSPYHVRLAGVWVAGDLVLTDGLLAPFSSLELPLARYIQGPQAPIEFAVNDDHGLSSERLHVDAGF